jgi:hypothetical protein
MLQMKKFFPNAKHVLYDNLFGFQPNHSRSLALIEVTYIYYHLDRNEFVLGPYLDFKESI